MNIDDRKFASILDNLADLVEFAEQQEAAGVIDGAHDPKMAKCRAIDLLNEFAPEWRDTNYCELV